MVTLQETAKMNNKRDSNKREALNAITVRKMDTSLETVLRRETTTDVNFCLLFELY